MIKTIKIRNTKTGNVRVLDYHAQDASDPPDVRSMHDKNKPLVHVDLSLGPDEVVISRS